MSLSLTISEVEYPELFKFYKKDRIKKLHEIFKTGYNIHFPNFDDHSKNLEYHTILQSIDDIKNTSGFNMDSKFVELIESIHKLTGISNNSSKRGEVGENMLEEIFQKRYGDIVFENKAKTPHSGDAWLHMPDKNIIMLESKNYTHRVSREEVDKMESDMITNHIRFGIFVSWSSQVQSRKDLELHTFYHNNETYMIIVISNLGNDIIKLDLGIQITRTLSEYFCNMKKFPWIKKDISMKLNEFDIIIQKNYKLRDGFDNMSLSVKNSMDLFYNQLREYQYEINVKAQDIIDCVKNTIEDSIEKDMIKSIPNSQILKEFKKNKKLFPMLSNLLDVIDGIENIILLKTEDNSIYTLVKENMEVGTIKIKSKKASIYFTKLNFNIDLEVDKYNESIKFLPDICKNI